MQRSIRSHLFRAPAKKGCLRSVRRTSLSTRDTRSRHLASLSPRHTFHALLFTSPWPLIPAIEAFAAWLQSFFRTALRHSCIGINGNMPGPQWCCFKGVRHSDTQQRDLKRQPSAREAPGALGRGYGCPLVLQAGIGITLVSKLYGTLSRRAAHSVQSQQKLPDFTSCIWLYSAIEDALPSCRLPNYTPCSHQPQIVCYGGLLPGSRLE